MLFTQIQNAFSKPALLSGFLSAAALLISGATLPKESHANTIQLAQLTSLEPQTITVMGRGQASVPAQNVAIVLTFVSNSYPEYSEDGELKPQTLVSPSDLQPVVDAVTAEGIAADIQVSRESFDYQYLQMVVKLENPTKARINKIREVATQAALTDGQFTPTPAGVLFSTNSCDRLEAEARSRAIADAREQAAELAEASGLALGDLLAIAGGTELNYYGSRESGCISDIDKILENRGTQSFAGYQPASAEVTVDFGLYATYGVEE